MRTAGALCLAVVLDALAPRLASALCEFVRDVLAAPEVHLIGRLSLEGVVRHRDTLASGLSRLLAACASTRHMFSGSSLSATVHARIRREKSSMTPWRYALVPSRSLIMVTSMCHASFGAVARKPTFGLGG